MIFNKDREIERLNLIIDRLGITRGENLRTIEEQSREIERLRTRLAKLDHLHREAGIILKEIPQVSRRSSDNS